MLIEHIRLFYLGTENLCSQTVIDRILTVSENDTERAQNYTGMLELASKKGVFDEVKALFADIADQFGFPDLWEMPKPFAKEAALQEFPVHSLPSAVGNFLQAAADSIQISPSMAALPMLSVLSLCMQGKAVIRHPGSMHTESLNLYTLTIAQPGERKSSALKAIMQPVTQFQTNENKHRAPEIQKYLAKRQYLENQRHAAVTGKTASVQRAQEMAIELSQLQPVHPLILNITDVTPEALVAELANQGGTIGIIDDEGGVFDVISGMYTAKSNIDIFLKGYDGSPYVSVRKSSDTITLDKPLLAVGIMTQQSAFDDAMQNKQFVGRGFIHRFLFSFPSSKAGARSYTSENIPEQVQASYTKTLTRLLMMPKPAEAPQITCNKSAGYVLRDYFDYIEERLQTGKQFEYMKEWANKQFGRCLKIAGILHLCEHTAQDPLDEQTATNAVNISMWCENQAIKALGGYSAELSELSDAKYMLSKIREKKMNTFSERDMQGVCRRFHDSKELQAPLDILADMHYIAELETEFIKPCRKPSRQFKTNPLSFGTFTC